MPSALEQLPILFQPADCAPGRLLGGLGFGTGNPAVLDRPPLDGGDGAEHVPSVRRGVAEVVEVGLDEDPIGRTDGDEVFVRRGARVDCRREGEESVWVSFLRVVLWVVRQLESCECDRYVVCHGVGQHSIRRTYNRACIRCAHVDAPADHGARHIMGEEVGVIVSE